MFPRLLERGICPRGHKCWACFADDAPRRRDKKFCNAEDCSKQPSLAVHCGGHAKPTVLKIGSSDDVGNAYVRSLASSDVYTIDSNRPEALKQADAQFVETQPHRFALDDVDAVVIEVEGTRRVWQTRKSPAGVISWLDDHQRLSPRFGPWIERMHVLPVRSYLWRSKDGVLGPGDRSMPAGRLRSWSTRRVERSWARGVETQQIDRQRSGRLACRSTR